MKVISGDVVIQRVEKFPVVFFAVEDGLLPVASCDHVIESTSVLYAGWARHEGKLSCGDPQSNKFNKMKPDTLGDVERCAVASLSLP
jgi:hypothetical protein